MPENGLQTLEKASFWGPFFVAKNSNLKKMTNKNEVVISSQYTASYLKAVASFSTDIKFVRDVLLEDGRLAYVFSPKNKILGILQDYDTDTNHPTPKDLGYFHYEFWQRAKELKAQSGQSENDGRNQPLEEKNG